jgi:hypothetical protein
MCSARKHVRMDLHCFGDYFRANKFLGHWLSGSSRDFSGRLIFFCRQQSNHFFHMKKFYLLFCLLTSSFLLFAQAPQGIPYQAIARNASGQAIASTAVKVRFSIRDSIATGAIKYQETHNPTTSALGLFSVNVGMGTVVSGTFSGINWGKNSKFLQVELNTTGGTTYTDLGTTQMMSVPFALYAGNTSQASLSNSSNLIGRKNIGFSTSGTWVCPAGVTEIMVQLWGGGGGGASDAPNGGYQCGTVILGGSGGKGGYNRSVLPVVPGQTYNIIVGQGGAAGNYSEEYSQCAGCSGGYRLKGGTTNGSDGGVSSFNGQLFASGGTGGTRATFTSNGVDGIDGSIINFDPQAVGVYNPSSVGINSYIPTGYILTNIVPTGVAQNGKNGGGLCPAQFYYPGSGENGFVVISY